MIHMALRIFLLLAILGVAMSYAESGTVLEGKQPYLVIGAVMLALAVIAADLIIPRKTLQGLSGVFFGLLVGLVISYGLNLIVGLLFAAFAPEFKDHSWLTLTKLLVGIITCYLCVSFILQTKDDVRFVIPYVEFSKQVKGQHPLILDTSVIIDGRIVDIAETGILDQTLVVPRFVLNELQAVADSTDKLKRNRGRRGLDVLQKLQGSQRIEVQVLDPVLPKQEAGETVDLKLIALARMINGRLATNDYNLNKIAQLRGIEVININDLANALKPVVLPGEAMSVKIMKPGESPGQGVGYLDDGTMVVVEQGRGRIGETVSFLVTSVLQTSAGRMIFGRMDDNSPPPRRRGPEETAARGQG